MGDKKTESLLNCKREILKLGEKTTEKAIALGKNEKDNSNATNFDNKPKVEPNPNRTLFSPESLREHKVPGYVEQNKTEELEELEI